MNLAEFVLISVTLAIQYFAQKYRNEDYDRTLQELESELGVPRIRTYDFIVVGGGSAGCTVAGRLSEHFSVLLLEAGGTPVPQTDVAAFFNPVLLHPDINYFFTNVPQPDVGQDYGGVFEMSFGKMLGGSGSHNDMIHNRGNPRDFDNWAEITGDPSWAYDSVLEYFKKYENFSGPLFDSGDEDAYGHDGPLQIQTYVAPLLPTWFEAARELGYEVHDPNARQRESFTPYNVMLARGKRSSAFKGFIEPFEGLRRNLTVLRYSDVEEVLIDDDGRAFGVVYNRHGIAQRAYASKEVIISCGSVRSPLLLMKSGIGPADVLAEAGIPIRVERPGVGRNLSDHVQVMIGPVYINDTSLVPRLRDEADLERYHQTGEGILGEVRAGPQAFISSTRTKQAGEGDWPDLQFVVNTREAGLGPAEVEGQDELYLSIVNGRSRGRGWVRLNGTEWRLGQRDDQKLAVIDPQLLTDSGDVDVLLEGIKFGLNIFENTTAFLRVGAMFPAIPHSECLDYWYRSDEYWRCYIRRRSESWNHFVGTNSMGRVDDPYAVVDSSLRVFGVGSLRVIDASVMPVLPNANINAPTIMLAEKGADAILRTYRAA